MKQSGDYVRNMMAQELLRRTGIQKTFASKELLMPPKIAIVMPVYNEGDAIRSTIGEIQSKILRVLPTASLFIFEDGSRDETKRELERFDCYDSPISITMSSERKGYAKACRDALMSVDESKFSYVLFLDGDGQYDPNDFFKLLDIMTRRGSSTDIVMGRRLARAEPGYRIALSNGLGMLVRRMFQLQSRDVTSAFRLMRASVAKSVAAKVKYTKYSFWQEFTARSVAMGYVTEEVPVVYRPRRNLGQSNIFSRRKMSKVVLAELRSLALTWRDCYVRKET